MYTYQDQGAFHETCCSNKPYEWEENDDGTSDNEDDGEAADECVEIIVVDVDVLEGGFDILLESVTTESEHETNHKQRNTQQLK